MDTQELVREAQQVLGDIFADARNNGMPSADLLRIVSHLFASVVVAELGGRTAVAYTHELADKLANGRIEPMH